MIMKKREQRVGNFISFQIDFSIFLLFLDKYDEKETTEIKIKYKKADILKVYQEIVGEIKIDTKLAEMKEEEMPFVNNHSAIRKVFFIIFYQISNVFFLIRNQVFNGF